MNLQPDTIRIREMQSADVSRVFEIDRNSFTLPWSERSYLFEIEGNDAAHCFVATIKAPSGEEEIIGISVTWLLVDTIHIATIATAPQFRQQGVAERMLRTILAKMIPLGATEATLEVRESNLAAQNLYHKLGFEIITTRENYYSDTGEAAYIMTNTDISAFAKSTKGKG